MPISAIFISGKMELLEFALFVRSSRAFSNLPGFNLFHNNHVSFFYLIREGYVPGNPSTQPITVAHFMVDGGSDDASLLQQQVTPDESLGDGLKVYRDSFNAY